MLIWQTKCCPYFLVLIPVYYQGPEGVMEWFQYSLVRVIEETELW